MNKSKLKSFGNVLFQSIGLGFLGANIFLAYLTFSNIALKGYFWAVEPNPWILAFEWFLSTVGAGAYLVWLIAHYQIIPKLLKEMENI